MLKRNGSKEIRRKIEIENNEGSTQADTCEHTINKNETIDPENINEVSGTAVDVGGDKLENNFRKNRK